ncbi:MAG TPA: hypothetical protein VI282_01595 [Verrucomicrobiae bacterium]
MSFWSRLFKRSVNDEARDRPSSPRDAADPGDFDADSTRISCGFCGSQELVEISAEHHPYPIWECRCGGIGSGAILPDLDEVADQLLDFLGIDARVSQPCAPVQGSTIISMQRYDVHAVERNMTEILKNCGGEFRVMPCDTRNERMYWVKKPAA